jgi:hypothetical protein
MERIETIMKRLSIAGMFLTVAFALSGLAASSASALPKGLCWKVEKANTGNYTHYCLEKAADLDGSYVLAEIVAKQGTDLWCAKIDNSEPTGTSEGSKCEKLISNGLFTTVLYGLPTFLLLTGSLSSPITLLGVNKTLKTRLSTIGGELTGEGFLIQILWTLLESGSLGPAQILFENVGEKSTKCKTSGDGTGLVLIDDAQWHLVYILLDPLEVGILFLIPQFTMTCGVVAEKIKGSWMWTMTPLEEWVAAKGSFEGVSKCLSNKHTPGITKYWNDEGEEVTAKLEVELNGLGKFEEACLNLEVPVKLETPEMLEISQP